MLYTSYFANIRNLPANVVPIAISRGVPDWFDRQFPGQICKRLAPTWDMLNEWKKEKTAGRYTTCFQEHILDKLSLTGVISDLHIALPRGVKEQLDCSIQHNPYWHVALICYEKPDSFCHRHLVAEWFNKNGISCEEWR